MRQKRNIQIKKEEKNQNGIKNWNRNKYKNKNLVYQILIDTIFQFQNYTHPNVLNVNQKTMFSCKVFQVNRLKSGNYTVLAVEFVTHSINMTKLRLFLCV